MSGEIRLPNINGGTDQEQIQQIRSYLYQLARQLRYELSNLSQENFSEVSLQTMKNEITDPVAALIRDADGRMAKFKLDAEELSSSVSNLAGDISKVSQKVDSYKISVTNGKSSSTLELKAGDAVLSSEKIEFQGIVTFTSGDEGYSVIDGGKVYSNIIGSNEFHTEDGYFKNAWFADTQNGYGTWTDKDGIHFFTGKLSGAWQEIAFFGCRDWEYGLFIDKTIDGIDQDFGITVSGNLSISGGDIHLNGNVYVNGTKIS